MVKRIFTLLLALVMVLGMFPATHAHAAEGEESVPEETIVAETVPAETEEITETTEETTETTEETGGDDTLIVPETEPATEETRIDTELEDDRTLTENGPLYTKLNSEIYSEDNTHETSKSKDCEISEMIIDKSPQSIPVSSAVANSYTINGKTVRNDDFPSKKDDCWNYANEIYNKIWGTKFTSYFNDSNNMLRNLSDAEITLTEAHLKEYVGKAALGSSLRICNAEWLHSSDGWGHSLIIVQKDNNGFTIFEGGLTASPHRREKYFTWKEFMNTQYLAQYQYIKYIKWPNAPAYSSIPSYTVTYHPNGGTCSTATASVQQGKTISSLPTASMTGMSFAGWYTQPYGGSKITTSTVINSNMTVYAHYTYAYGSKVKLEFDPNGGSLPGPIASKQINGVNIGRPAASLVVFNKGGTVVNTNSYGAEVAVEASGKVIGRREYGDENHLTVPDGGFVLSGQAQWDESTNSTVGGVHFVWSILAMDDPYVALDYETGTVTFYDSCAGYLAATKMGQERTRYGALPVPERFGYVFNGWTANGYPVSYYTGFMGCNLVASWTKETSIYPKEQMTYNGHLYERYDDIVSWEKAQALCEFKGGHLVTITNSAEQNAVLALAQRGERGTYKIGATDNGTEGTWRWVTGEKFSYSNWDPQGPEPSNGSGENYASIVVADMPPNKQVGEWIDITNTDYARIVDYYDLSNTGFICEYDFIPTCDHSYSGKVTTAATCTTMGIKTYTCTKCGDSYAEAIAAKGHTETTVSGKAATCTEAGKTDGKKCSVCGTVTVKQTSIAAKGHTEVKLNGKAATCTETGLTEGKKCSVCGTVTVKQTSIAAKGHTEVKLNGKAATCTETGLTEGKKCSVCGTVTVKQTSIAAKGHTEVKVTGKAATCTDAGKTDGKKCSVCGVTTVAQQSIKALGHTGGTATCKEKAVCTRCKVAYGELNSSNHTGGTTVKNKKAATCTEKGYSGDTYCKGCDAKLSSGKNISATDHNYIPTVIKPTYTQSGYTEYTCEYCRDSYKDNFTERLVLTAPVIATHTNPVTGKPVVTWDAVEGATYKVYRSTYAKGTYKCVGTVEGGSFEYSSASIGKMYFKVKVVVDGETSKYSAYKSATCKCAQPQVESYITYSTGKVNLSWKKVSGAKKYYIYRATSEGGKYTNLGYTTKLKYTDSSAKVGTRYYYKIKAVPSSSSYSTYSAVVNNMRICAEVNVKVTIGSNGKPSLSWSKISGAKYYKIARFCDNQKVELGTTTSTTFKDLTAEVGQEYSYYVTVIGKVAGTNNGTKGSKETSPVCVTCAKPSVSIKLSSKKPKLSWKPVEGATKYYVYRATSKSGKYTKVATVTGISYTDKKAKKGKTYYYKVKAIAANSKANSVYSSVDKIKSK